MKVLTRSEHSAAEMVICPGETGNPTVSKPNNKNFIIQIFALSNTQKSKVPNSRVTDIIFVICL